MLDHVASLVAELYARRAKVDVKGDGSLVTEADIRANEFLRTSLQELFPSAGWLSEETVDHLSRLDNDWLWVVDPLDGTKEFSGGVPEFAVSVGLVYRNQAVLGGVVNPVKGQGGIGGVGGIAQFWGLEGEGVHAEALEDAAVIVSRSEMEDGSIVPYLPMVGRACPVGSVAYKLLRVASGIDDLTFSVQPKSEWDVCGGVALLAAAGKTYRRFDGKPVRFNERDTRLRSGSVAGSSHLVEQFLTKLHATDHLGEC